jgi:hypothetical protein
MSVEFEQENAMRNYIPSSYVQGGEKGMVGWLIKKGVVKTKMQANILLLTLTIIFIILAFTWSTILGINKSNTVKIYKEDISQIQLQNLPENQRQAILNSIPSKN